MPRSRPLRTYATKRDFAATPEPPDRPPRRARGAGGAGYGLFVVQKHAARNLHYDFRLEHNGVLLSWAVPKGPSLDPRQRRLAVQVEDHPLDYAGFEGRIPAGNYGAGTVEIWDRGRWEPHGDVDQGLRRGRLDFRLLHGKLAGEWHLVRMKDSGSKPNWLLFRGASGPEEGEPLPAAGGDPPPPSRAAAELFALATLVDKAPAGDGWVHETKWDGYRLLAAREGPSVRLWSRSGADWTDRLPEVAAAVARLAGQSAIVDGELVALAKGRSSFQALQNALAQAPGSAARSRLRFFAFDLLMHDGEDLRPLPLRERKRRLSRLLVGLPRGTLLRPSPHRLGKGSECLALACARGQEGIVSKRADAGYHPGRSRDWLKIKCHQRQELVIVGYTDARGAEGRELGALVLATARTGGGFDYAGRVGTGFDRSARVDLRRRLAALSRARSPLAEPVPGAGAVHWVQPRLVAEVRFSEWTADGRLRHPSFVGLRDDKAAGEVQRERPATDPPSPRPAPSKAGPPDRGEVAGVTISHPERLLFPDSELTKLDLARHFEAVWPLLQPHLRGRPLAFVRCPQGARAACFFQKHWPGEWPGLEAVNVSLPGDPQPAQARIESAAGLAGLAQHGVIELHLWGARQPDLEHPDRVVFDLDPGEGVAWPAVVAGARLLRALLGELGLESFALLSGGKGVHVVAPILPQLPWATVQAFAAAVAGALAEAAPTRYVARSAKRLRPGRIFIDYLRNARGATAIAPYSPRARARGTVATPVSWEELARSSADRWTIATLPGRLRRLQRSGQEPWPGYFRLEQVLSDSALARVGVAPSPGRGERSDKMPTTKTAKARKAPAAKTARRAPAAKAAPKRYGKKAAEKVERALHEMKRGELRSGRSKKKVTSRKQAIAIGLSEAREAGAKVPAAPRKRPAAKRKHA